MNHHLAAIESGTVTKTNVIGFRKAIKATIAAMALGDYFEGVEQ